MQTDAGALTDPFGWRRGNEQVDGNPLVLLLSCRGDKPAEHGRSAAVFQDSSACNMVTAMIWLTSSALQPRERSLAGLARP